MFCTAGLFPRIPRSRWQERYPGLIPNPQRAENLPSSCAFRPQQFAGNSILCERRLIGEARRALRGDHTGSGTASYSFVSEESGNLDIAIVVRHDLSQERLPQTVRKVRHLPAQRAGLQQPRGIPSATQIAEEIRARIRAEIELTADQVCTRTPLIRMPRADRSLSRRETEAGFAADSPVEGAGFEPSVPRDAVSYSASDTSHVSRAAATSRSPSSASSSRSATRRSVASASCAAQASRDA
jgi:hypothetical protein